MTPDVRIAGPEALPAFIALAEEAAEWLWARGICQWKPGGIRAKEAELLDKLDHQPKTNSSHFSWKSRPLYNAGPNMRASILLEIYNLRDIIQSKKHQLEVHDLGSRTSTTASRI